MEELTLPPPLGIILPNELERKGEYGFVVGDFLKKIIPHVQAEENEKAGHEVNFKVIMRRLEHIYIDIEDEAFKIRYPEPITYKKKYERSYAVMMTKVSDHRMPFKNMKGYDRDTFQEFYEEIFERIKRRMQLEYEKKNHERKSFGISEISKCVKSIRDEKMGASTPLDTHVVDLYYKRRADKARRLSNKKSEPVTEELRRTCFKLIEMRRSVEAAIGKAKMAGVCGDELVAFTKEMQSYCKSVCGKHE
eukprot:g2290.t1